MSREVYLEKKQQLSEKLDALIREKDELQKEHILKNKDFQVVKELKDLADTFLGEQKLTKKMVDHFIKEVVVYDEKHIEIIYKFEDKFKEIMEKYQPDEAIGEEKA